MPTCGRGSANSQKQRPWHCGLGAGRREAPRAQLSPAAGWRLSEEQAGVTVVTLYSLCSASPREPCRLAAGTARIRGRGDGMYKARKRGEDWVNNTPVPKAFCSLILAWVEFQRAQCSMSGIGTTLQGEYGLWSTAGFLVVLSFE